MKAVARCRWSVPEIRHVVYLSPSVAGFLILQAGGVHLLEAVCTHDSEERIEDFFCPIRPVSDNRLAYIFVSESCLVYVVLHMIPAR